MAAAGLGSEQLRVCLVELFNQLLLLQKLTKEPKCYSYFCPKPVFGLLQIKSTYPRFHLLLGKKITQLCHYQKNGSFFFSNRVAPRPPHFAVTKQTTPPPALLLPVAVAAAASPPRPVAAAAASPAKLPARAKSSSFGRRWRAWEVLAADLPCGQRPWSSAAAARPSTRWTRRCSASA